jgi:hypothetical protein
MGKINPNRKIQRYHTEDEMRSALERLSSGRGVKSIPPQVEDDDIVLTDCIEELLEGRRLFEEMRGFTQVWSTKLTRKQA